MSKLTLVISLLLTGCADAVHNHPIPQCPKVPTAPDGCVAVFPEDATVVTIHCPGQATKLYDCTTGQYIGIEPTPAKGVIQP